MTPLKEKRKLKKNHGKGYKLSLLPALLEQETDWGKSALVLYVNVTFMTFMMAYILLKSTENDQKKKPH